MITKALSGVYYFVALLLLLVATTKTAHAYLDAGTGSMVIQVIAGVILGGMVFFRQWFDKLKGLISKKSKTATRANANKKKSSR